MSTTERSQSRALNLLKSRVRELVDPAAPISRRPRTLSISSAAKEALYLGKLALQAKEANWPERRGEKMRRDVAEEALELLRLDQAMRLRPQLAAPLRTELSRLSADKVEYSWDQLNNLTALSQATNSCFLSLSKKRAIDCIDRETANLIDFEETLEQVVSHVRAAGWSDKGIAAIAQELQDAEDASEAIEFLYDKISSLSCEHTVRIQILEGTLTPELLPESAGLHVVRGPNDAATHVDVRVSAHDPWAAATSAYERCATVLGAACVFQHTPYELNDNVSVTNSPTRLDIQAKERLRRDTHNPRKDQIRDIIRLAAESSSETIDEAPLYFAVRNHHRANSVDDVESSFVLLWTGLERLCSNPMRPEPLLSNTARLVSSSLAFGKIRREVSALSEAIAKHLLIEAGYSEGHELLHEISNEIVREGRFVVSHAALLAALTGSDDDSRKFTAHIYSDPRLTQWYFRLRRSLVGIPTGAADLTTLATTVPCLIESSRRHTEWQVKRLYRARNGIAHGFERPRWLADLARHANYYLTNMISICLAYSSGPNHSSFDTLQRRQGWLDTYLSLAKAEDALALSIEGVLRPSSIFR